MAIRPIVILPDPVLRRKAEPVAAVDADIRQLMDDMLETMYDARGSALRHHRSVSPAVSSSWIAARMKIRQHR